MRDFVVGDYVIYNLEVPFIITGIVESVDDKCLTITGDNDGYYKDYKNKFELDYQRNRDKRINTILE